MGESQPGELTLFSYEKESNEQFICQYLCIREKRVLKKKSSVSLYEENSILEQRA